MYDHISFHLDNLPSDVSPEHALNHMGFYYAWAVGQNLHSVEAAALPDFATLQAGQISGAAFIRERLNGGLDETCFNDWGNRFTQYYYADDDEGYGLFLQDYFLALDLQNEADFYHVKDTQDNQHKLNRVFQKAWVAWLNSLKAIP